MARNGSGVYSLPPGSTITNGDTSDATDLNTPLADIAADLNVARPIVSGGTGAVTAAGARSNLGLAIGTNVQASNANLASLSGLTLSANKGLYSTGANTVALFDLTAAGRALLDDADAAAQRTTLGLGTAATVDMIDEDDMATDSATRPPSQQSVKAYVDRTRYTSAAQTISSGGLLTLAHGLGAAPGFVSFRLKCTTADAGYAIGDEIIVDPNGSNSTNNRYTTPRVDATNVYIRFSSDAFCFTAGNKSTGGVAGLTNASWNLHVEAML